ncbi:MAG: hypothetical protein ACT6TH_15380 [Brevundimonas sp.]|uniref:hypothetical protein n=1 Tax=Brevundimonas sp. TaxID=1871086 RepID=UPI004033D9D7
MCDFKPGDEVEKFKEGARHAVSWPGRPPIGTIAIVEAIYRVPGTDLYGLDLVGWPNSPARYGFAAENWRKVHRRDLTAWLSAKATFEEPKRTPAKRRERA